MAQTSIEKEIEGFADYTINTLGEVWSKKSRCFLKGSTGKYKFVRLTVNSKSKSFYIHQLLAKAFLPQPSALQNHVNHKDGNRLNNSLDNLEWITQKDNNRHAYRNGLIPSGERHYLAKLSDSDVKTIRNLKNIKSQREIAKQFSISQQHVSKIQRGGCRNVEERCA